MTTQHGGRPHLPDLPGIDRADGLARAMDDEALYASVLHEFLIRYRSAPEELQNARADDDYQRIQLLVHKLKGVIGTIGARDAFRAAEQLECSWAEVRQPPLDNPTFDHFCGRLTHLLSVLGAAEETLGRVESGRDDTHLPEQGSLPSQLAALADLLDDSDVAARPLFHSLRSSLAPLAEPRLLEAISQAIDDLEFERASQLLQTIPQSQKNPEKRHA